MLAEYRKAVLAFLIAGLGSLAAALADGSGVTPAEWVGACLLSVVAAAGVWAVPNQPAQPNG